MDMKDNNPFNIPDLTPMYKAVTAFVKEKQGEKEFIDTQNERYDTIWAYEYLNESLTEVVEMEVKAVRVNPKSGNLEMLTDLGNVRYSEEDIRETGTEPGSEIDNYWKDVRHGDQVLFIPTIFNIAENIQEYTD